MLNSYQKSTGTQYTGTVALLILALIFIPAMLILSRPVGYDSMWLGAICSASCLGFAWRNWKKHSQLTIPSLETLKPRPK
jgi:hypothetical protein